MTFCKLFAKTLVVASLAASPTAHAGGVELRSLAADPAIERITALAFDGTAGRLLAAAGTELLGIDPDTGAIESLATFDEEIAAVAHDRSAGVLVVDSRSAARVMLLSVENTSTRLLQFPGPVSGLAANGRGWIFATAAERPAVYVADSRRAVSLGSFPVAGCDRPASPIVDDAERRLYVTCGNGVLLGLDSDTGVVVSRVAIPAGAADIAMSDPVDRQVRIVVATAADGLWLASGRITARSAEQFVGSIGDARKLAPGRDGLFVVRGETLYWLRHSPAGRAQ